MPDEENPEPSTWVRITQHACAALNLLLRPELHLSLLVVAMIEALVSPFLGWRFALASLATAAAAVGLILAHGALGIQCIGLWLQGIHKQVLELKDEELKKLTDSQRRAAPEKPLPIN